MADARPDATAATVDVPLDLLIRADSLLSLLWHRHVPADRRDAELQVDVERTIDDLRQLTTPKPKPHGPVSERFMRHHYGAPR